MDTGTSIVLLALAVLAHALASRIPSERTVAFIAAVVYVFALVIVLWCVWRRFVV